MACYGIADHDDGGGQGGGGDDDGDGGRVRQATDGRHDEMMWNGEGRCLKRLAPRAQGLMEI